jgi:proteic killer suppression protein
MAIRDYRDKRTADFVAGERVREFQAFAAQAAKGIAKLQNVSRLVELRNPPSNRFEALRGGRAGQYSIRINDRWRICFKWGFTDDVAGADEMLRLGEPYDVEITDYH